MRYLRPQLRTTLILTTIRRLSVKSHEVELVVVHAEVGLRVQQEAVAVDADVADEAVFKRRRSTRCSPIFRKIMHVSSVLDKPRL